MVCTSTSLKDDQYPMGMRVMVVDDDTISLNVLKMCLLRCGYQVTTCTGGVTALSLLRENWRAYDLVMLDVHMPVMNGLQLLQVIRLEMDIPVVMVSGDSRQEMVMKGLDHGACDYLVKPFTLNQVRNVWQHVVRRRNAAAKNKRKRDGDDSDNNGDDNSMKKKKRRMKWSSQLHHKFLEAVNKIGIDKAVPKKILELMDVPGLLKEQVASHLQKFRECLKKAAGVRRPNPILEDVLSKLTTHALGYAKAKTTVAMPSEGSSPPDTTQRSVGLQTSVPETQSSTASYQEMTMNYASTLVNQQNPAGVELLPCTNSQIIQHEHHSDSGCTDIHFGSSLSMPQLLMEHSGQGTNVHTLVAAQGQVEGDTKGVGAFLEYNCGEEEDGILQEDFLIRYFDSSNEDAFLYTF